jgi:hypothetical protein
MTTVANPDPGQPGTFVPQYLPTVFAQPVAAGCFFGEQVPCSLGGNLALGYTSTAVPTTQPILWGQENTASFCFLAVPNVCPFPVDPPVLRVNFTVPTDYTTATIGFFDDDPSVFEAFEAFDNTGQSVARCEAFPPFSNPAGCATVVIQNGPSGWALFTLSRPTADISFVLVGALSNIRPIAQMQFHSPVSLQLAGLRTKVQGVGPGKALANMVLFAQTYYAVPDIPATCAQLTGFVHLVKAQEGKMIANLTALQLLSTATAIEAALGCR